MLKKIIFIFLLILPTPAVASGWDDFIACLADPCNCGDANDRIEYWNNQALNKGKKNAICPPWNKTGGRHNHTCLAQSNLPQPFIWYYSYLCAEETPESSYFTPKIRIRGQQCNALACWTTSNSLKWDGQCKTLAGAYGLPLHRMCARIAVPANYSTNFPQDPGYTPGVHLNYEGATVPDTPIIGYDGQPLTFNPPKLCAYYDPAFLSFKDGFDLMDLDPGKQSYHKTNQLHPVIKVIIFFFQLATQSASQMSPFSMLSSLFTMITGSNSQGLTTFMQIIGDIFDYMNFLIKILGEIIIDILKEIGQINRAVDSTIYGCVKIPMGPYPPPFCPTVAPLFETAYVENICQRGSDGAPLPSTGDLPCVVSTLDNNFVRNSVRITFENYVPLCSHGEDPSKTDKCVVLENLGAFGTASTLHTLTGKTDIVPSCANATGGQLCVNTMIAPPAAVINGSQGNYRLIYGVNVGGKVTPKDYFRDDLSDCPNTGSVECQQIWGVNTSAFVDASVTFPAIQNISDIGPIISNASMKDKSGAMQVFTLSIVRSSTFDPVLEITQEPDQLCVSQNDIVVGCVNRVDFVNPTVYDCSNQSAPISCSSSYFAPKLVATITAGANGSDSTSAIISPASVYNKNSSVDGLPINLAGYNFSAFVTDDTFVTSPFKGTHAPNSGSLYGNYLGGGSPLKSDGSVNDSAIYESGLEYVNNRYYVGGKYACLQNLDATKCPDNVTNCVLTNLLNTNVVNCSSFISALEQYPNVNVCSSNQSGTCPVVQTISGSGGSVYIRGCTVTVSGHDTITYCYTTPGNQDICKVSMDPPNRYLPVPSLGSVLSNSQYYDPGAGATNYSSNSTYLSNVCAQTGTNCSSGSSSSGSLGYNFDQNLYALRDKTSFEQNLCTLIPQPTCAATNDYNADSGYASWPETPVGEIATGTCQPGKNPVAPLQRRCVPNPDNRTFRFEPLSYWDYTQNPAVHVYSNVKCQ